MSHWIEMDKKFSDLVKGKTVAIVGPAATTIGREEGAKIDSCDIVVRVKSFMYPREMEVDLGTRTDILYTTEARDRVDIQKYEVLKHPVTRKDTYKYEKFSGFEQYKDLKFVVSTYPEDEWFADRYTQHMIDLKDSGIVDCRFVSSKPYFTAKDKTNRPNSGFSALLDVLSFDIASLHIFGLDFHRTMYREGYQNSLYTHETIKGDTLKQWSDGPDNHMPDLQYAYFKYEMWKNDTRIIPNQALLEFLQNDKYDKIYGD